MRRISVMVFAALLVGAAPGVAWAQPASEPAPVVASPSRGGGGAGGSKLWPPHRLREKGLMLGAGFGVDGCTDHACDGLDAMVFFRIQALYRMFNFLAVGLHFGMPFYDPDSRSVDHAYNVFLGPEVRGILPLGPLDLWSGIGLGWIRAEKGGEVCWGGLCADGESWANGFGLAWGLGALFYLVPRVGIGLDFWLYKGFYDQEYWEAGGNRGHSDVDQKNVGITWMLGVTGVYFLPL